MPAEHLAGFVGARAQAPPMTHVRSTWLLSSVLSIRHAGHYERYARALQPEVHDAILATVAGGWVETRMMVAHYAACDALELPEEEQIALGGNVTRQLHGAVMDFGLRLARESGATPWTPLGQAPRLFGRVAKGGAVSIYRLGPKDARAELLGYPVAASTYARLVMRGSLHAIVGLVSRKVFVTDVPSLCTASSLGYRIQWV